ncbi:hypothetical protein LJR029_003998 [Caballeronia sp. LjRoot29]
MKAHLLYKRQDFLPGDDLSWVADAPIADFEINTLVSAIASADAF